MILRPLSLIRLSHIENEIGMKINKIKFKYIIRGVIIMKKFLSILLIVPLIFSLVACTKQNEELSKWDCSVACAEESTENNYIVTYSNEKIISKTGLLTIQNRNDFDIAVSLHQTSGEEEKTVEIKANGVTTLHNIEKNKEYTLGCHADVKEGMP